MKISQPVTRIAVGAVALCASLAFVESSLAHDTGRGYIVLGDSIEYGLGASSPDKAYVPQFHAYLESTFFQQKADPHNLAVPGATARDIKQANSHRHARKPSFTTSV